MNEVYYEVVLVKGTIKVSTLEAAKRAVNQLEECGNDYVELYTPVTILKHTIEVV